MLVCEAAAWEVQDPAQGQRTRRTKEGGTRTLSRSSSVSLTWSVQTTPEEQAPLAANPT